MYQHILIPTDGSTTAEKAVAAGVDFAREAHATVVFFTAVPEYPVPSEAELLARRATPMHEYERKAGEAARAILDKAARLAREASIPFETDYALNDHPSMAIIDAAKRHHCDAIFMATHGRTGLAKLVHGSETQDVLVNSDIPTLVYR
ncbi:MAG TPA: universal stress protein [Burkholderiales bacterium]|jgi:nucleotide-binding universal stress UspA family protein|nr:universal stress protein [Burkholderiales bacterium]